MCRPPKWAPRSGLSFDPEDIDAEKAQRSTLLKAFPRKNGKDSGSTLTHIAANSLEMSDRAIRTQATRTRSFETTFTDLLDPTLVPTSVYGFVANRGRYLGIAKGRISQSIDGYTSVAVFREWLDGLAVELSDPFRRPSVVFDRYAEPAQVTDLEAAPKSVLLDLTSSTFQEFNLFDPNGGDSGGHDLPYEDLCVDVADNGEFFLRKHDGSEVKCEIKYRDDVKRYRIVSPELDAEHGPISVPGRNKTRTLTNIINRKQEFRVLTAKDGVVFSLGSFYHTRDFTLPDGTVPALVHADAVPLLKHTKSEKGETFVDEPRWATESIFGAFFEMCSHATSRSAWGALGNAVRSFDTVVLDDDGTEIADFIGLDKRNHRVALIHAKASNDLHTDAVTQLQAVGRQAISSLAFCSSLSQVEGIAPNRWKRGVTANKVKLNKSRFMKRPHGATDDEIDRDIRAALQNPRWSKEVWIVAGRLLDVEHVRVAAQKNDLSNRLRQLLMFLMSLRTACGRANAQLRIFGH
jgi:hypothetical protein